MNSQTIRSTAALVLFCALPTVNRAICTGNEGTTNSSSGGAVRVLVAYYSLTGNTEQMAKGVAEGIKRVTGAVAIFKKVDEVS